MIKLVHGEATEDAAELALAEGVLLALQKAYPNHRWRCQPNLAGGVVAIDLMYPDQRRRNATHGMMLKVSDLASDPLMIDVVRLGGELLERWGLSRGAARDDTFQTAKRHGLYKGEV